MIEGETQNRIGKRERVSESKISHFPANPRTLRTHTPQIWVVRISPPKFRERSPENTVKQVLFEDPPPILGGDFAR